MIRIGTGDRAVGFATRRAARSAVSRPRNRKPKPVGAGERRLIVVADDDGLYRDAIRDWLEYYGFDVVTACDGEEALAQLRNAEVALAVVDLMMPRMHGWDLIARMRNDPELDEIPVIVLTARGDSPVAGADRVFEKPCSAEQLLEAVMSLSGPKSNS